MTSSGSRSSFWGSSKKEEKKDKKKEKKSKKDKPMVGKVIGAPTNFQRHMHIGFNKDSGEFEVRENSYFSFCYMKSVLMGISLVTFRDCQTNGSPCLQDLAFPCKKPSLTKIF